MTVYISSLQKVEHAQIALLRTVTTIFYLTKLNYEK